MDQTILGIDVGSSKICAVIASVRDGVPHIIGVGRHRSQGLKKGLVVNIDLASKAIKAAVEEAKSQAEGTESINKAIVSVSGAYTKSVLSSGVYNVTENEITIREIGKALNNAVYNASIPQEFDVIHVLPYKFRLDEQDHIEDPMGMTGRRLEVFAHIVTAQHSSLENLRRTIQLAGVEIQNIVLASYASSIAVLSDDEKNLGVACIDIGGSTCEIMIHDGNAMRYNNFFGVGSHHITSDLAITLNTKISAAEEVKIRYGDLGIKSDSETGGQMQSDQMIEVPSVGVDEAVHFVELAKAQAVIKARVLETFGVLARYIDQSGLKDRLGAGIVLTGGMMNMQGIRDLAKVFFHNMPTRISKTIEMPGIYDELRDPSYSTVLGLIWYGAGKCTNYERDSMMKICHKEAKNQDALPAFSQPSLYAPNRDYQNILDTDLSNLKEDLAQGVRGQASSPRADQGKGESSLSKAKQAFTKFAEKLF